jgi:hypothetical protein
MSLPIENEKIKIEKSETQQKEEDLEIKKEEEITILERKKDLKGIESPNLLKKKKPSLLNLMGFNEKNDKKKSSPILFDKRKSFVNRSHDTPIYKNMKNWDSETKILYQEYVELTEQYKDISNFMKTIQYNFAGTFFFSIN